jgi:hypothetical protein
MKRWLLLPLGLLALATPFASLPQAYSQSVAIWPQTLPANSVVGRIGAGQAGPAEAIPFATLSTLLSVGVFGSQAANTIFSGPTSGAAATPTWRLLVGADLPTPTASTLGGVESLVATSHQWINTISTAGVPSSTQPAFSDISGTATTAQLPVGTNSTQGILQGDSNTLNISAGVIACQTATSAQIGCSKPDNTTITAAAGVLTAIGSAATSITVGTTTIASQVNANDFLTTNTTLADPGYGPTQLAHLSSCVNCGISAASSGNNVTFTLTDEAGNAISATDPAVVCFRNDNTTNAEISCVNITSAPALSVHATSNFGVSGTATAFRVWLALFNNAGTAVMGAIVAVNFTAPVSVAFLNEVGTASATVCAGCTNATSAKTWYASSSISSKAYRIIGYVDYPAFTVNGDWVTATGVHLCNWGCVLPGRPTGNIVQTVVSSADAGSTSTSYANNTSMEVAITPTIASNLVRVTMQGTSGASGGSGFCSTRVIRGTSGSVAIGGISAGNNANQATASVITGLDAPSTASSQTYTGQRATSSASTTCVWPASDATGATTGIGFMTAEEIQG